MGRAAHLRGAGTQWAGLTGGSTVGRLDRLVPARARLVAAVLAAIVCSLYSAAAAGAGKQALETRLDRALNVPNVSPAASAAFAIDLETGKAVYSRNASLSLLPASNEKLAVAFAALTALGPSFRIETDVLGEGEQVDATWQGDLVLKGYGDPTLSPATLRCSRARCARRASRV